MFRALLLLSIVSICGNVYCSTETEEVIDYVTPCESCRILALELEELLSHSKDMYINKPSYSFDNTQMIGKDTIKKSVIPLHDAAEIVCERALKYHLRKDRVQGTKFDTKRGGIFDTLADLMASGVNVDIGYPQEMWNSPSADARQLQLRCENILEEYEDEIEEWYFKEHGSTSLADVLCKNNILKDGDQSCFLEVIEAPKVEETETVETEESDLEEEPESGDVADVDEAAELGNVAAVDETADLSDVAAVDEVAVVDEVADTEAVEEIAISEHVEEEKAEVQNEQAPVDEDEFINDGLFDSFFDEDEFDGFVEEERDEL